MKFTYHGCEGAPEVSIHYGVEFTIGVPAEVEDEFAISKLSGHPHFTQISEKSAPVPASDEDELVALRLKYCAKFGKKPHHKMKAETIREKLNADDD